MFIYSKSHVIMVIYNISMTYKEEVSWNKGHYNVVIWTVRHLKLPVDQFLIQLLVQANYKENTKALHN